MIEKLWNKYCTQEQIDSFISANPVINKYSSEFYSFLEQDIKDMLDTGDFSNDQLIPSAFDFAIEYFTKYDIELSKGHSKEWAKTYSSSMEHAPHPFNQAYLFVKDMNRDKARKELEIHCNAIGADDLYTKHFIYLMENGEGSNDPGQQALLYSKHYKEQINIGRSELYAHQFSDEIASGESLQHASVFAKYYEIAILEKRTTGYAFNFANTIREFVANQFQSNYDFENDDYFKHKLAGIKTEFETKQFK